MQCEQNNIIFIQNWRNSIFHVSACFISIKYIQWPDYCLQNWCIKIKFIFYKKGVKFRGCKISCRSWPGKRQPLNFSFIYSYCPLPTKDLGNDICCLFIFCYKQVIFKFSALLQFLLLSFKKDLYNIFPCFFWTINAKVR